MKVDLKKRGIQMRLYTVEAHYSRFTVTMYITAKDGDLDGAIAQGKCIVTEELGVAKTEAALQWSAA